MLSLTFHFSERLCQKEKIMMSFSTVSYSNYVFLLNYLIPDLLFHSRIHTLHRAKQGTTPKAVLTPSIWLLTAVHWAYMQWFKSPSEISLEKDKKVNYIAHNSRAITCASIPFRQSHKQLKLYHMVFHANNCFERKLTQQPTTEKWEKANMKFPLPRHMASSQKRTESTK